MKKTIYNIILSGGVGKRLWPLSRPGYPKQFLKIFTEQNKSLFDLCIENNNFTVHDAQIKLKKVLVGNFEHRFILNQEYKNELNDFDLLILEPLAKNTFVAILIAILEIKKIEKDNNFYLFVTPSDHLINDKNNYQNKIIQSFNELKESDPMFFGIPTNFPSTQYGYIETEYNENSEFKKVKSFTEKPSKKLASSYHIQKNYYWNSGIFLFSFSWICDFLNELKNPILNSLKEISSNSFNVDQFITFQNLEYSNLNYRSIDYELFDHFFKININRSSPKLLCLDVGWDDLGSFKSILNNSKKDKFSNYVSNSSQINIINSSNNLVFTKLNTIVNNLNNLVIIQDGNDLLVSDINSVPSYENTEINLGNSPNFDRRPWGYYEVLDRGVNFLVKKITIFPKHSISLQFHKKRSEHWVVTEGNARVNKNNHLIDLSQNESIFIKKGEIHQISNTGPTNLVIIEVQTGNLISEDDIVRLEDQYDR